MDHAGARPKYRRLRRRQVAGARERFEIDAAGIEVEQATQARLRIRPIEDRETGEALGPGAAAPWRERIDEVAAGDRPPRRLVAQDQPIAMKGAQGAVEDELHQGRSARGDRLRPQDGDAAGGIGGTEMEVRGRPVGERARFAREHPDARVQPRRRRMGRGGQHPVTAPDVRLAQARAGEVEGAALTRHGAVRHVIVSMDAAHPDFGPARREEEAVTDRNAAGEDRSGYHEARALDQEHPVDGEAKMAADGARRDRLGQPAQGLTEPRDAIAGHTGDRYHGRAIEAGAREDRGDGALDLDQSLGRDPVGLGQRDEPMGHAEQVEYGEVLQGLGHGAIVGRDHEEGGIDGRHAGQHVAHQSLVPGHVDEARDPPVGKVRTAEQ